MPGGVIQAVGLVPDTPASSSRCRARYGLTRTKGRCRKCVCDLRFRRFLTTADRRPGDSRKAMAPSAGAHLQAARGLASPWHKGQQGGPHGVPKIPDHCHSRPIVSGRKAAGHRQYPFVSNNSRSRVVTSRPTGQPVRTTPPDLRKRTFGGRLVRRWSARSKGGRRRIAAGGTRGTGVGQGRHD